VAANDYRKRITPEEAQVAVDDYPGKMTLPPEEAYDLIDKYVISDNEVAITFEFWYDNEKSELTLTCNLKEIDGKIQYSVDGIRIL
jgi:hypothetical protein